MKKSFLIHLDSLNVLDELSNEQSGILFKAIKDYHNGLNPKLDFGMRMAFLPFENQFKRDAESYDKTCERNKENGKKGGRPKKPTITEKTHMVISKPKKADSDNDSDSDNNKNIFKPPTIDEIQLYCKQRNNNIDVNKFYDFYESKGWYVGKNKMKDWKASIRTWENTTTKQPYKSPEDKLLEYVKQQTAMYDIGKR